MYIPLPSRRQLILSLACLNGIDAVMTVSATQRGLAVELNPLLADLLAWSPLAFLLVKSWVGIMAVVLLLRIERTGLSWPQWATPALMGVSLLYLTVFVYHLVGLVA
jgi:hypothetical protein